MINMQMIKEGINIRESKTLNKMKQAGEIKMYNYLSGIDPDSSYTGENIKSIMTLSGDINWDKVEDPSNALFNIGYSEQGNVIGILTNANALLQDMLLYCTLNEARTNLKKVLSIGVGSKPILGKRYAVNGQSPLTFALPVITKGGYKSYAVVIHNKHADEFIKIMESLDIDALDEEDMLLIAKDISFISRTQELAIDVAKDKTIQIVDTSQWLSMGVKPTNYWLGKQKDSIDTWYAKENIYEIIQAKKSGEIMPEFKIEKNIPESVASKVSVEVNTSESIAREVLKKAVEDYYNNHYKEMLLYSQETELNITAKSMAVQHKDLTQAFKQVLIAYRKYVISNMPRNIQDEETVIVLRKIAREKIDAFGAICRNTIYHLGLNAGYNFKDIAMIAYGADLTEVSKDEGKYFRGIMPEEFKKLYANGKTATSRERLFFVDELTQDDIDDGKLIIVDFKDGKAYSNDILIAKASHKFNAENCTLVFDEVSGHFYAEQKLGIDLPEFGNEVLLRIDGISQDIDLNNKTIKYAAKTENNSNVLYIEDNELGQNCNIGTLGYYSNLSAIEQAMLLRNVSITKAIKEGNISYVKTLLSNAEKVNRYGLIKEVLVKEVIKVDKDSEFETDYAVFMI